MSDHTQPDFEKGRHMVLIDPGMEQAESLTPLFAGSVQSLYRYAVNESSAHSEASAEGTEVTLDEADSLLPLRDLPRYIIASAGAGKGGRCPRCGAYVEAGKPCSCERAE